MTNYTIGVSQGWAAVTGQDHNDPTTGPSFMDLARIDDNILCDSVSMRSSVIHHITDQSRQVP